MKNTRAMVPALALLLALGCSCDDPSTDDDAGTDDGGDGTDGGGDGMDGGGDGMDGGGGGTDAQVELLDGAIRLPDGNVIPAGPIPCQGHIYACGDAIDNDGDGLIDDRDPDCLGPCDNNEGGFDLEIPGGGAAPCRLDCYFDQDTGSGNDQCSWDLRCDEARTSDVVTECPYTDPPPAAADCPDPQVDACRDFCSPLVPNGCDCFGCCNLPAGGDQYVFIGARDADGNGTCTLDRIGDRDACPACTPVGNCLNTCGTCELCIGRTELPPECFPDAGMPIDGGPLPDGATPPPDGGTPPPPTCDDGRQACGVPGTDPCPTGFFCLTGCCTFFG